MASYLLQSELGTPALAFTRAVCEALKLDSALTDEVSILRRNLLRMTGNREFGEQAAFKVLTSLACYTSAQHIVSASHESMHARHLLVASHSVS